MIGCFKLIIMWVILAILPKIIYKLHKYIQQMEMIALGLFIGLIITLTSLNDKI